MYVEQRFILNESTKDYLYSLEPKFGYDGFGEFIFYRTYSRSICKFCRKGLKHDGKQDYCPEHKFNFEYAQESWNDCVRRVTEGTFSIRKDWYIKNHIYWNEDFWQHYARNFAIAMFKMKWLPPGRGLWAMGTDFIYERGSMALQNCGLTIIGENIGSDINWMMDALMMGVGVGFIPIKEEFNVYNPKGIYDYVIPDTREGWCDATEALIDSFLIPGQQKPRFIYDGIRGPGLPIRGFGGVSSGPQALIDLHQQIEQFVEMYVSNKWYNSILFKTDLANCTGCCVVAGNVRRSAELMAGYIDDVIDLKNYDIYPYREAHGWMSNNSVFLAEDFDFQRLNELAERIKTNGEPGYINLRNLPYGRIGKNDGLKLDHAIGFNPCITDDTWIATSKGQEQVKDLIGKKFKAIVNGSIYNSTDIGFFYTGNKEVFEIKTKEGYSFKCTANHQILTEMLGLKLYIPLDKLNIGDKICLHNHGDREWDGEGTWNEGYILGWLFGDGSIHKKTKKAILYFYDKDVKHLNFVSSLFDVEPNVNYSKSNIHRAWISGKELNNLCKKFGVASKTITETLLKTSSDFYKGFISGFFDTDGTIYSRDIVVSLWQNNLDSLEKIQLMLINLGIKSVIYNGKEAAYKIIKNQKVYCNKSYRLNIASIEQVAKFESRIGFRLDYKINELNQKLIKNKKLIVRDYYINEIKSITNIGKKDVFDCQIPGANCFSANGLNLHNCGEQPLENKELCTLAESCPTKCDSEEDWLQACEYATIYASTVTLLPTHRPETNAVMLRNRRIGVGLIDVSLWKENIGTTRLIRNLREGYKRIRRTNKWINSEAGVPESIRVTTVKPGGTTPKLPGLRSGWSWPTFGLTDRRVRVARNQPVHKLLTEANVPYESDIFSANTDVFSWPIDQSADGKVKPATEISLWEQAMMLVLLQREWSDNAVSNTLYFKPKWKLIKIINIGITIYDPENLKEVTLPIPWDEFINAFEYESETTKMILSQDRFTDLWELKIYEYDINHEEDDIEPVLASIAPLTKSVSVLPHSPKGVYRQTPEEGITQDEYNQKRKNMKRIDWSKLSQSDGLDERYCEGPQCTTLKH